MGVSITQAIHAKETAICVRLALDTVEDAIRAELAAPQGSSPDALRRILEKIREQKTVLLPIVSAA
jgi:fermentation-respiration switch protein FrsA (DUF1100 family)